MRRLNSIVKRSVITLGLLALVVVLFPSHTEPLWTWAKTTGGALGYDALPAFTAAQGTAGLTLLILVVGGIAYTLWRDRRFEVLQAEYSHRTGANNLKEKVRDLENQLAKVNEESRAWQEKYALLNKQHTATLVAAKEYEVRSQYGTEDREELRDLRTRFERVLREKGHTDGFRVAMDVMMANLSHGAESPEVTVQNSDNDKGKKRQQNADQQKRLHNLASGRNDFGLAECLE